MSLSQRIIELIEEKNVTAYEIALKTGLSEGALSRIKNNNTAKMSIKSIDILANYFNVNRDWLKSGIGDKAKPIASFITEECPEVNLELEKAYWEIESLQKRIEKQKEDYSKTIDELRGENKELIRENGSLENQVSTLNRELNQYRGNKTE